MPGADTVHQSWSPSRPMVHDLDEGSDGCGHCRCRSVGTLQLLNSHHRPVRVHNVQPGGTKKKSTHGVSKVGSE